MAYLDNRGVSVERIVRGAGMLALKTRALTSRSGRFALQREAINRRAVDDRASRQRSRHQSTQCESRRSVAPIRYRLVGIA
ncbi:MAG: hypothetical protein DMF92_08600 [Acidobacteria bacterium]|nr:MAG: hypothetical protein DMF92_08600 [Acidobacteriota bacterium]